MYYYIFSATLYIVGGYGFGKILNSYMHELETKLCEMGYPEKRWDIYVRMSGSPIVRKLKLFIGGLFWPVTVIALLLRAEWKFSKITQP